jgi:hypothetical protein
MKPIDLSVFLDSAVQASLEQQAWLRQNGNGQKGFKQMPLLHPQTTATTGDCPLTSNSFYGNGILIAGEAGSGKSSLAFQAAINYAKAGQQLLQMQPPMSFESGRASGGHPSAAAHPSTNPLVAPTSSPAVVVYCHKDTVHRKPPKPQSSLADLDDSILDLIQFRYVNSLQEVKVHLASIGALPQPIPPQTATSSADQGQIVNPQPPPSATAAAAPPPSLPLLIIVDDDGLSAAPGAREHGGSSAGTSCSSTALYSSMLDAESKASYCKTMALLESTAELLRLHWANKLTSSATSNHHGAGTPLTNFACPTPLYIFVSNRPPPVPHSHGMAQPLSSHSLPTKGLSSTTTHHYIAPTAWEELPWSIPTMVLHCRPADRSPAERGAGQAQQQQYYPAASEGFYPTSTTTPLQPARLQLATMHQRLRAMLSVDGVADGASWSRMTYAWSTAIPRLVPQSSSSIPLQSNSLANTEIDRVLKNLAPSRRELQLQCESRETSLLEPGAEHGLAADGPAPLPRSPTPSLLYTFQGEQMVVESGVGLPPLGQ